MRSRFRTQMLQKRRVMTARIQWTLIGLSSLIALNTTLYWSLNQGVIVPPPDSDVSDFPIRQKVISIDDNWDDPKQPHWEVIDPVEETHVKPVQQEQHEKLPVLARKGESQRTSKKKVPPTDKPNVRYITLKSSVQEKEKDTHKFTKKQNISAKVKYETHRKETISLQKHLPEGQVSSKIPNKQSPGNSKVNIKSNNLKPIEPQLVLGHITYRNNSSYAVGGTLRQPSRVPHLRASPPSKGPGIHSTKLPLASGTGNIRYYSKPPWFSNEDIQTLRLLSEEEIRDVRNLPATFGDQRKAVLFRAPERIFQNGANQRHGDLGSFLGKCKTRDACAMVLPGNHVHEVLAFHVDRILGFNRTLPTVARNLPDDYRITKGSDNIRGMIYPITAFDANVHIAQDVLFWSKDKFRSCARKEESSSKVDCEGTLPGEISGLAMFDFLLQITDRLDRYCCGLALSDRPLPCGQLSGMAPGTCGPSDHLLGRIFRRGTGQDKRLVFTPNIVNLNVPSGRLDYLLLDGIESFPEQALSVLRTGKFRQMLLQSLFIDKIYWDGLGGRKAIEDILDVMDRRGKMLLKYLADKKAKRRT